MAQIFTGESCMPNRRIPFSVKLLGPYKGHVWAISGPCLGHLYNIFASRCLKWLNFLLNSDACQMVGKTKAEVSEVQPQRNVKGQYLYRLAYVHKTHFAILENIIASGSLEKLVQELCP